MQVFSISEPAAEAVAKVAGIRPDSQAAVDDLLTKLRELVERWQKTAGLRYTNADGHEVHDVSPEELATLNVAMRKLAIDWAYRWRIELPSTVCARIVHLTHIQTQDIVEPTDGPLPPIDESMSNRQAAANLEELRRWLKLQVSNAVEDIPKLAAIPKATESSSVNSSLSAKDVRRLANKYRLKHDAKLQQCATGLEIGDAAALEIVRRMFTRKAVAEAIGIGRENDGRLARNPDWKRIARTLRKRSQSGVNHV